MKRILLKKPQPAPALNKPDQSKVEQVAQALTDTSLKGKRG